MTLTILDLLGIAVAYVVGQAVTLLIFRPSIIKRKPIQTTQEEQRPRSRQSNWFGGAMKQ